MRICGIFLPSLIVGLGLNPTKDFKQSFFPYPTCDPPGEFLKIIIFKTGVKTSCCISPRCTSGPSDLNARVLKKMKVRIQQEFCLIKWWQINPVMDQIKSHRINPSIFLLAICTCGLDSSLADCFGNDVVDLNSTKK